MRTETLRRSIAEGIGVPLSQAREQRRKFGSGKLGKLAFRMITKGKECGLNDCSERGIETLDYDVIGSAEQLPVCGVEHKGLLVERIKTDLSKTGRNTVFGRNGFGRA